VRFRPLLLGSVCGSDSAAMTMVAILEGARGEIHFKRTGEFLGRFVYRVVIPHTNANPAAIAVEIAFRRVAARRVLARRALGADSSLTLTVDDGRRIDLFVNYASGRVVDVTATSGLY
jgi:hypothetical protein